MKKKGGEGNKNGDGLKIKLLVYSAWSYRFQLVLAGSNLQLWKRRPFVVRKKRSHLFVLLAGSNWSGVCVLGAWVGGWVYNCRYEPVQVALSLEG